MIHYYKNRYLVLLLIAILSLSVSASTSDDWFTAASSGDTSAIRKLLDEKANINDQGTSNMTPLMVASMFGKTEVVKQLINAHAGINLQSGSGLTALVFASQKGHADVVKLLLDAGADRNVKSVSGSTALMYATEKGYENVIALLKETKANKDVQPVSEATHATIVPAKSSKTSHVASGKKAATVTDSDGNEYHFVTLGTQTWTVENLRTTKFNDGTDIADKHRIIEDATTITFQRYMITGTKTPVKVESHLPHYWYPQNTIDADSIKKFGILYNWYAVDTKKLAPVGWHVPTDAEWDTLQNYLIAHGYNYDGTKDSNKIGKSMAAQTDWTKDSSAGAIGNDLSRNNRSGFSAIPGGCRNYCGGFTGIGGFGMWWSATDYDTSCAYSRYLYYNYSSLCKYGKFKCCGFSVRLVRDPN